MKFIIKAQKGLTRKIYQELDKLITSNKNVYVDGPYGGTFRDQGHLKEWFCWQPALESLPLCHF